MQSPNSEPGPDLPLKFKGLLVIVGGGAVDKRLLKRLVKGGAAVVAADGGADDCERAGVLPDAIVGDMDSIEDPEMWAGRTRFLRFEEQLTTDFEKCLYATQAPVTVALGMTGKRFDHTLAALDAVMRYAHQRRIVLVDQKDIALAVSGSFSFAVKAGERVSVHPLGEVRFAGSEGLKYPLDGLTLAPGLRTGTSNEAEEGPFSVEVAPGEAAPWLLLIKRRNLAALIAHLLG